jgi:molybdopterin-binding protein
MLYVAHDPAEVLYLAGELAVLDGGRLLGAGPLRDLAGRADLAEALHALGLQNVLQGTITAADDAHTVITLADGVMVDAPADFGALGSARSISISPADISIGLASVAGISIRNQLAGTVAAVTTTRGRTLVTVDVGVELRAEVSLAAVAELGLVAGKSVRCLFKAQAVRAVDGE